MHHSAHIASHVERTRTGHSAEGPHGSRPLPELRAMLLAAMIEQLASNRAACDHWKTLGSRLPRKRAYASASYQLTPDTG